MICNQRRHRVLWIPIVGAILAVVSAYGMEDAPSYYSQWTNGIPGDTNYFPLAVWLQSPHNATGYKEAGINLFVGLWQGPTTSQLSGLDAADINVICHQNSVGLAHSGDTIWAWMHGDEPDNAQPDGSGGWGPPIEPSVIIADYQALKTNDLSRPIYLNLGQGVAWDGWYGRGERTNHPEDYWEYVKGCDIVSYDIYPVNNSHPDVSGKLEYVARGIDRLRTSTQDKKPVWCWIETTKISADSAAKPTPAQVRSEVWMALIHGADGIGYFCHSWTPSFDEAALLHDTTMLAAVSNINHRISALAPVLNSPTITNVVSVVSGSGTVPIDILVKQFGGHTYIFAAAMSNQATTAIFTVPAGDTVDVLDESRQLTVTGGTFTDSFAGYAVHLYKVSGNGGGGDGSVFYVDPVNGSMSNDGSEENPWSTLQEVFENGLIETRRIEDYPWYDGVPLVPKNAGAPVKAGDTIRLRSGYHGEIEYFGGYNTDTITIEAQQGHTPALRRIRMAAVAKWKLKGLTVSPSLASSYSAATLVFIESHGWHGPSHDVVVESCRLYSVADSSGWSADDWNNKSCNGISAGGDRCIIISNRLLNVNFGIDCGGESSVVSYNVVENFAGDGLRGLGNYSVFEYNTVKNCYDVNANHDDGFQSWSYGSGGVGSGVVKGLVLRGNVIINYTDPSQPFKGTLQGIGCFDGFFDDWIVENNIVMVDHWHGISLYGARNCRVVNNTVVDLNTQSPGPPWIMVTAHKNGTPATNCIVRNNLSTSYSIGSDPSMTADHNLTVADPDDFFVDHPGRDLRLKAGCAAIDAGTGDTAPPTDIVGVPRPQGSAYDLGAYEYPTDDDGDGMGDWWEILYFGSTNAPLGAATADRDNDGASNRDEYGAGTDPTNPDSVLALTDFFLSGDSCILKWNSVRGKAYSIQKCTDLETGFSTALDRIDGDPPVNTRILPLGGAASSFYRIIVAE